MLIPGSAPDLPPGREHPEPVAANPFLPRPAVVALLRDAAVPLVLLAAPAGSGKSMALLALARDAGARGQDCHWIHPEALADAPREGSLLINRGDGPWDAGMMAQLRARLPRQRIAIAVSGHLPQSLRDEWIAGRASLITAQDLAFSPDETAALFGQALPSREAQLLCQFTRGWPLGLGLLSRDPSGAFALMRREGAGMALPQSLSRWFDDWLDATVCPRGQQQLMDLAIFGDFPATVLQALPAGPGERMANTAPPAVAPADLLRALAGDGLFLTRSTRPGWFSLMPAFARHLRDRLDLENPGRAAQIRRFAVEWSSLHRDASEEIRHGLAVWSPDEMIARVDAAGSVAVSLAAGPDLALEQPISATTALTAPLTFFGLIYERIRLGAFAEARVHYDNAARMTEGFTRFQTPQDARQIGGWIEVFSAVIRISADTPVDPAWRAGFQPALRDAISRDPVLAMAQSTVAMLMALNAGECEEALAIGRLAMQLQERSRADKAAIFVCLHRASALIAQAALDEARLAISEGEKLAADHTEADSYEMISCQIHAGLCAFEAGEMAAAQALLEPCHAHLASIHGWRRNWLEYFTALAEIDFQSKGYAVAGRWISRGHDLAAQRDQPQLALGLQLAEVDFLLRDGQTVLARQRFDALAPGLQGMAAAPQIDHMARLLVPALLLADGRLPEAAAALQQIDRAAIAAADLRNDLQLSALGLDLALQTGDLGAVQAALQHCALLAPRLPRLGRELGHERRMQNRLRQAGDLLAAHQIAPEPAVQALLAAIPRSGRGLLSPRETQIIRLIAEGLSTKEIARNLGTSDGTVKTHRKNLYEKLKVSSRSAAIARARELRLIQVGPGG
ncbi:hypothetical protein HOY34_02555 [Xinfangfangia sp. D13-10-4-6]|uniref:helix-turn-helix transcriptional regulator n=1 Tax=Pseudogemmobacter hezensis TaxID=2737662 RepID=UPI001551BAA0|nr:LuxR C-terminal-related transcriptional regulator [Pseudogemmobacter hezensis]NPD14078.1 hypothetical protein [Pseudogemmobacter hezensis]